MCGIAGFVDLTPPASGYDHERVAMLMAGTMSKRGPDDEGAWSDPKSGVAFGHRRLAVIDLSTDGHQPMTSANGRFVISYNGEVYNFPELKHELQSLGCTFRTNSDTEVILEACATWGVEKAVGRFIGMFAFALWDKEERTLTLVRDRLGIKPLYYGWAKGVFLFASEVSAFSYHPAFVGDVDRNALAAYLRRASVPAPFSIYQGIEKLAPGQILKLSSDGKTKSKSYWDIASVAGAGVSDPLGLSDNDATEQLELLLKDAVAKRMISDVPIGAFLSGGVDSSTVVALMQGQSSSPVKTFTVGFSEAGFNEANHASAIANHLGTDHTEVMISKNEILDIIPKLSSIYDEPFADPSQIPTCLISEVAKAHVTVALSGDGGDELFAGYNRHAWAAGLSGWLSNIPGPARKVMAAVMSGVSPAGWDGLSNLIPKNRRPRHMGEKIHKLAAIFAMDDPRDQHRILTSHWNNPEDIVIGGNAMPSNWDDIQCMGINDAMSIMQLIDAAGYLPDDILTKVDRASMGVSLEARVPLLDHRVAEFSWGLSPEQKFRNGKGKWLLRRVLERHVPNHLTDRPKAGFDVPINDWLRGPLRHWAEEMLGETRLNGQGYLASAPIRRLWQDHLSGKLNGGTRLWAVLMFQSWLQENKTQS